MITRKTLHTILLLVLFLLPIESSGRNNSLKQNTNTHVIIGPLISVSDGVTPVTSPTLGNISCNLINRSKNGTVTIDNISLQVSGDNEFTHLGDGYYYLDLTTDNVSTLGQLRVELTDIDVFVGLWEDFSIKTANVYDSEWGDDKLQVDMTQWEGNEDVDAQAQSECADALTAYDPPTNTEMEARTLLAANYFDPSADTVANVTTVATLTGHTAQTGDSFAIVNSGTYGNSALKTLLDTIDNYVDTEVAAILTNTNAILEDTNEIQGKLPINKIMGSSVITDKDDEIDAIKDKTDNLPDDPADDSDIDGQLATIDSLIDAIKVKTDDLNFNEDATAKILCDLRDVNDSAVSGFETGEEIVNYMLDAPESEHQIADSIGKAISRTRKHMDNRMKIDATADTMTVYGDDGETPEVVFDLYDSSGTKSDTNVYERVPQ